MPLPTSSLAPRDSSILDCPLVPCTISQDTSVQGIQRAKGWVHTGQDLLGACGFGGRALEARQSPLRTQDMRHMRRWVEVSKGTGLWEKEN